MNHSTVRLAEAFAWYTLVTLALAALAVLAALVLASWRKEK